MRTRTYRAFGLTVASPIALPQFERAPEARGDPDVRVVRGGRVAARTDCDGCADTRADGGSGAVYRVTYPVADAVVRDGREIRVTPARGAPVAVVRRLVTGPLFNHLLAQRGYLVVHASTVRLGGVAVAFAGDSGSGKSTTAAAFLPDGGVVLSDDAAAVTPGDPPTVQPGAPAVKLDPDAVDALDVGAAGEPLEAVSAPRRFYRFDREWSADPLPLACVYVLDEGETRIEPLPPGEQCMALVRNTYTRGTLGAPAVAAGNVRQCAAVADAVAVKRLTRPRRFDALPDVVAAVRADVEGAA